MSIAKKIVIAAVSLMLLVAIVIGVLIYLLTSSPDMHDEMRAIETGSGAVQSFEQKIEILENDIKSAVASGQQKEVELVLTESEASVMLGRMMKEAIGESADTDLGEMTVDAMVNFDEDLIRAIVDIGFYGVTAKAGAEIKAIADEQGLSLELQKLEMGQIPLLGSIEDKIMQRFNESHTHIKIDDLHIDLEKGLPVELKTLVLQDREMVITGLAG